MYPKIKKILFLGNSRKISLIYGGNILLHRSTSNCPPTIYLKHKNVR